MAIYDYNSNTVAEQLTPSKLRQSKFLAWLYVICSPIQNLWSLIFNGYKDGSNYNDFNILTTYNFGDRVIYTDKSIYEATYTDTNGIAQSFNGVECINPDYWTLVNENFIGASERIKYTSQFILLEYALNKWYRIPTTDPQIYIEKNDVISAQFVMGESSDTSSSMPNDSVNQIQYMVLDAVYPDVSYDFIVWVPDAVFTTLGTNTANRENNVKNFVDKYKLSGIKYKVDTYI